MLLTAEAWPLWIAFVLMAVSAVVNSLTLRVPNWLTLPALGLALLVSASLSAGAPIPSAGGGLVGSVLGAVAATLWFIKAYTGGQVGAGPLKMQLAFGAWIGCAVPAEPAVLFGAIGGFAGLVLTYALGLAFAISERVIPGDPLDDSHRLMAVQPTVAVATIASVALPISYGWLP